MTDENITVIDFPFTHNTGEKFTEKKLRFCNFTSLSLNFFFISTNNGAQLSFFLPASASFS